VSDELTRRDAIRLAAAATLAASVDVPDTLAAQAKAAAKPGTTTFFTRAELALVDELSEMIIPTDDHSPGARAAKVAGYIDARLAEAFEETDRTNWRQGLKLIEDLSKQAGGRSFLESSPEQRLALLQRIAGPETKPEKAEELFFVELKSRVVDAYYTSEIGINQELEYRGNTFQAEFSGIDVSQER
jgi:glucoside 3-dehydrogenase (cytochrome c) hitch-hiker subunit